MPGQMKRDWVVPVLEDITNFLRETQLTDFADDLEALLDKYGDSLSAAPGPAGEDDATDVIDFSQRIKRG